MAIRNRTELHTDVTTNIKSGNADTLAVGHREVEDNIIDSCFNILTDDSDDINMSGGGTLTDAITDLEAEVDTSSKALKKGTVDLGNTFGLPVGTSFPVTGDFSSALVAANTGGQDVIITVNLAVPLANTNYMPVISVVSQAVSYAGGRIFEPLIRNETTSSFQVILSPFGAVTRDLKLKIQINEL